MNEISKIKIESNIYLQSPYRHFSGIFIFSNVLRDNIIGVLSVSGESIF
jgi:hypothetical protein